MNKTGMNMERVRKQNRSLILRYIHDQGAASRKEIAAVSTLTQASITQITTALIREGFLTEAGSPEGKSGPGRREVLLTIDSGNFLTYAVNVEPDRTTVALCDFSGDAVTGADSGPLCTCFPTRKDLPPEQFLDRICSVCRQMEEQLPKERRKRIECFSFAITGIVDREKGISRQAYGVWDEEVNMREIVHEKLGLPVLIENNVDAYAIAELLHGAGREYGDIMLIKWGPGVGSSVIIDGHVYRGRHGKTAELGHMIMVPGGEQCVCGRRGCLETIVSASALAALSGQEKHKAINTFARAIVNAGTILAPKRIVLYGGLAEDEALRNELISECASYASSFGSNRILYTSLSDRGRHIGPASVYSMHRMLT